MSFFSLLFFFSFYSTDFALFSLRQFDHEHEWPSKAHLVIMMDNEHMHGYEYEWFRYGYGYLHQIEQKSIS